MTRVSVRVMTRVSVGVERVSPGTVPSVVHPYPLDTPWTETGADADAQQGLWR
jgi:hypothetical protein